MKKNKPMHPAEWMHEYNDKHREKFNRELFERDDQEVIQALKNVILSCQRDLYFTIKVTNFTVVEDYEDIYKILYEYEQERIDRKKGGGKKEENRYKNLNMKDSSIILLIIDYYIAVKNEVQPEEDTMRVIIKIPRIVDKYYYKLSGSYYMAIYQIVDGSTYNNTNSSSKKQSVTFKTVFMPTRLYRNVFETVDYNGYTFRYVTYTSRIFNKNVPVIEYFLAKYGLIGTLEFMGFDKIVKITNYYNGEPDTYCLNANDDVFIEVPKYLFDRDVSLQCTVMSIYKRILSKEGTYTQIKTRDFWLEELANRFQSKSSKEKGLSILDSLESIYDIDTHNSIKLPEEEKSDIYHILRWMLREFAALRLKDNTDISTKKIRRAEYMAAKYAIKVSKGLYRVSDVGKRITCKDIKRWIYVDPDFLIDAIIKDKLVSFNNNVNDDDGVYALKFSYKGQSGLGDGTNTTIPDSYRHVDQSHLGRVDPDASSASDPGLTGIICPLANIHDNSFADKDYQEPNDWHNSFTQLMNEYRQLKGARELVTFHQNMSDVLEFDDILETETIQNIDSDLAQKKIALESIMNIDNTAQYIEGTEMEDGTLVLYDAEV